MEYNIKWMHTDDIRYVQLKAFHRALWKWLAKNPDKRKFNWPAFKHLPYIDNACFACEQTSRPAPIARPCNECIISWSGNFCMSKDSEYYKWLNATSHEDRTKYANIIAELWP